jgi:tetratricopeptide (TPR) repeat protein
MTTQTFLRCSLGLALSIGVFGQTKPPVTGGGGGATVPPPRPGTTTQPNFPSNTPTTSNPDLIQRPVYISGKVRLDDGTPPPEPVALQLICRGTPHSIGYTDAKGTFGIDLNNRMSRSMYMDASDTSGGFNPSYGGSGVPSGSMTSSAPGGIGGRDFMGCDVRASLAGFRSDDIHLDAHRSMDNPEIGTIFLHRLANVEGLTISATSRLAPKDAQKAFEKGRNDAQKKKFEDAQRELEKAVGIYPKYAAAWFELGLVQEDRKNPEEARKSFAQALAADAKYVNPYLELAAMAMREQNWQEAAGQSDHLLRLNPVDFPQAWLYNALSNYYLKNSDAAEKSAREGIARDTTHRFPMMNRLLGVLLAQKQDYAGAAQNMRDYLHYAPQATDTEEVKKQLADVEKRAEPEAKKQ